VLPVAIASGATRKDVTLILDRLRISELFSPIVTADKVTRSKPDPETYELAAEGLKVLHPQLSIERDGCLAIEDTAAGVESARGAGLRTLGLATTTDGSSLGRAERVLPSLGGLTIDRLRQWYR
jgi:beta-phosphoglucomutase-like phosphatase (HAD superfamily)